MVNKILWSLAVVLILACVMVLVEWTDKLAITNARLKQIEENYNILTTEYEKVRKEYEGILSNEY